MDMQHGHGHAALACSYMPHWQGHAAQTWKFSMDMDTQQGQVACPSSTVMQHGQAAYNTAWTCSMETWKSSMIMYMQHGYEAWT